MDSRKVHLYIRQIHEGGAKIAEFLHQHPDINPHDIDNLTEQQEADLTQYCSDLAITHTIERDELDLRLSDPNR
jgi:hypothetical protein